MLDIHTHYDVEVLNGPSLSESLRHGVTTVMLGSCSLSTVYIDGEDAGDIFGRVEAIPRDHVIAAVDRAQDVDQRPRSTSRRWRRCRWDPTSPPSSGTPTCGRRPWAWTARPGRSERPTKAEQAADGAHAAQRRSRPASSECLLSNYFSTSSTARSAGRDAALDLRQGRESCVGCKSLLRRAGRVLQSGPDIEQSAQPRLTAGPARSAWLP